MAPSLKADRTYSEGILVWDLGVRLFHWLLLVSVVAAALTGFFGPSNQLTIHLMSGLVAGALTLWRVIWGFLGSTYARFDAFAPNWRAVLSRLSGLKNGTRRRYLSHNPLGALMVLTLLSVIWTLAATGTIALGGELKQGAFAFMTTYAIGVSAHRIHELFAVVLVGLIGLHLLGVIFESVVAKENLVGAMVFGVKSPTDAEQLPPKRAYPALSLIIFVVSVGCIGFASAFCATLPGLGVPAATLDPIYVKECGACHFAYPPSALTAQTWKAILRSLDHHFGENASLPDASRESITAYLAGQSGDHFDTRVAHVFARVNPEDPLRLTATRFWRRSHKTIPNSVFASKAIGAKGACDACHHDASTGRFDPQATDIPEKAFQ